MKSHLKHFNCNRQMLLNAIYDFADEKHFVLEGVNSRKGIMNLKDDTEIMQINIEQSDITKRQILRIVSIEDTENAQIKIEEIFMGVEGLLGGGMT